MYRELTNVDYAKEKYRALAIERDELAGNPTANWERLLEIVAEMKQLLSDLRSVAIDPGL